MMSRLTQWLTRFEAMSIRERGLISSTLLVVTGALWFALLGAPGSDKNVAAEKTLARLEQELQRQQERLRVLENDSDADGVDQLTNRQAEMAQLLNLKEQELDTLLSAFVPPEQVPVLLEDVLSRHEGLTLVRVAAQPAQALVSHSPAPDSEDPESAEKDQAAPSIYRHPVSLEFTGGYLDVVAYLKELEAGDWQFRWRRLDYQVDEFPKAHIRLEVETLSQSPEWIGV